MGASRVVNLDEMLGEEPSSPDNSVEARLERSLKDNITAGDLDAQVLIRPVSAAVLAKIFRMSPNTVAHRLRLCDVEQWDKRKTGAVPKYDFRKACAYLVDPKVDIEEWFRSRRTQDMPTHLSDQFWKAMQTKQRVLKEAGDLWHTEDVLEVFGEVFIRVKESSQIWIEALPGKDALTTEQYEAIQECVAELLREMHQKLIDLPREKQTKSAAIKIQEDLLDKDAAAVKGGS